MSRRFSALGGLQLTDGINFWASRTGVDIFSKVSNISLAVELMTPFSLVDELDGEGEGAGEGVLAAEEPRLDSNSEPLDDDPNSSNRGRWWGFLEASAEAAYGLAEIILLLRLEVCPPNMTGPK